MARGPGSAGLAGSEAAGSGRSGQGVPPPQAIEPAKVPVVGVEVRSPLDRVSRQLNVCREVPTGTKRPQQAEGYLEVVLARREERDVGLRQPVRYVLERLCDGHR